MTRPLTIQTKRLPYAFRSLADKISDGVNQILMVEVTANDTTVDLGLLCGEGRRELAAHLRDVANELDPILQMNLTHRRTTNEN
jgi:hypothetical protein